MFSKYRADTSPMSRFMSITALVLNFSNPAYQFDAEKELLGEKMVQEDASFEPKSAV